MPAELQLAQTYDVSRATVRHALSSLQRAGLIETWTGAGSFVCYDGAQLDDQLGWSQALSQRGVQTDPRILRFERIDDIEMASEIGIVGTAFLALDRVRMTLDGEPISLERSRVPWLEHFAVALDRGLVRGSLRRTLEACGVTPVGGVEEVSFTRLSPEDASLLKRAPGDAFLAARRTSHDASGTFVERVDSLLHPDHFRLQFAFGKVPR